MHSGGRAMQTLNIPVVVLNDDATGWTGCECDLVLNLHRDEADHSEYVTYGFVNLSTNTIKTPARMQKFKVDSKHNTQYFPPKQLLVRLWNVEGGGVWSKRRPYDTIWFRDAVWSADAHFATPEFQDFIRFVRHRVADWSLPFWKQQYSHFIAESPRGKTTGEVPYIRRERKTTPPDRRGIRSELVPALYWVRQ